MLDHKTPRKQARRGLVILAAVFSLTSTTLTVSAQTEPGPADPAPDEAEIDYPADTRVCSGEGWTDVDNDSDLARACLAAVGINSGTAVYAFARPANGYDPDNPMGGGPEEAGLVSRWAMAEALYRSIDAAVDNPMPEPSDAARSYFTDVGWLPEGTRNKIAVLYDLEVTAGTSQEGIYDPAGTVTRGQMALFFVRTLRAVEQLDQLPDFGPPDGAHDKFAAVWEQKTSEINSAITSGRWDCTAESFPAREQLGVPFVDVCGWENDSERIPAVWLIYHLGITVGFPADDANRRYYRAAEPVTGGQMAKFLVRLLAHTNLGWHPHQQPPEEIDLPETQKSVPVELNGNIIPAGSSRLPRGTLLTPSPSTRPPREMDIYSYAAADDSFEVYWSGERASLSAPFSLQIGDWSWNHPQGNENESLDIVVEFRAHTSYVEGIWPMQMVYSCIISDNKDNRNHRHYISLALRVAPGVFRWVTNWSITLGEMEAAGDCDPADYGILEPDGGYTHVYPCATRSDKYRQFFASECRT